MCRDSGLAGDDCTAIAYNRLISAPSQLHNSSSSRAPMNDADCKSEPYPHHRSNVALRPIGTGVNRSKKAARGY